MRISAHCAFSVLFGFVCCGVWCTGILPADGPDDNVLDNVRKIPPAGIELSSETRQQLITQAQRLTAQVDAIPQASAEDRAEVIVFARAITMAVEDGMFYSDKEVEQARALLKVGEARAIALSGGASGSGLIGTATGATEKPQLLVGGFRSRIDDSVQPYGLVLPVDAVVGDQTQRRLDVWLHGRGEKTSESAFLYQRLNSVGEIAPANTIVLHPYGRYCNAFRFAGEVDVLEAIEHVKKRFAIDEDRIVIRGFSMGGAGCWQMAVHYPGKWMAATPGAGFSETTEFLRAFQKETFRPTAAQSKLLNWYDCPGWANNLRALPTIAYSGEIDNQKQAADIMEAAMKERGLVLKHIIGPQTAHALHPDSKVEIEEILSDVATHGRERVPKSIDFTTFTLRYPQDRWLRIEGLEQHWRESRVQAVREPASIDLKTLNVTRLTIDLPADSGAQPADGSSIKIVVDDTAPLQVPMPTADKAFHVSLRKIAGVWALDAAEPVELSSLRKRPGLQGPIDDAFLEAFVFVAPDAGQLQDSPADRWIASEFEHAKKEWRRQYRGEIQVRTAEELTPEDIAQKNLVLFGTPHSNPLIAKIAQSLPVQWPGTDVAIGATNGNAAQCVPVLIYPNPLNPQRYVVLNSSFTFREYAYLNNARQIAMLPDWALIDVTAGRNAQMPGRVIANGFFDEAWQLPDSTGL